MSQSFYSVDQGKGPQSPAPSPGPHPLSGGINRLTLEVSKLLVHTTRAGQLPATSTCLNTLYAEYGNRLRVSILGIAKRASIGPAPWNDPAAGLSEGFSKASGVGLPPF